MIAYIAFELKFIFEKLNSLHITTCLSKLLVVKLKTTLKRNQALVASASI